MERHDERLRRLSNRASPRETANFLRQQFVENIPRKLVIVAVSIHKGFTTGDVTGGRRTRNLGSGHARLEDPYRSRKASLEVNVEPSQNYIVSTVNNSVGSVRRPES